MKISLELVPRDEQHIREQTAFVTQRLPQISTINFPDLLRFDIRAWEACGMIDDSPLRKIAHLRAIDFDPNAPFPHAAFFRRHNITDVLVIEGDKPQDMRRRIYPNNSLDFIAQLKREMPELKIYAGFDPYRNNIRYEMEYLSRKIAAGAEGFFSQPFFDLRLLEIYAEYLAGSEVFWGITPVTTDKSRQYWETRNNAIFPKAFEPTPEWNIRFGRQVLDFCRANNSNLYLMPIRIDLEAYLKGLFEA
jgi:methylenetetrahydrofolate reductase (NADPH)